MKKSSLSMIIACIASFNAHTAGYAGLNLGINSVTIHKELTYPLDETTPTTSTFNNAYTNFHGQILAGYELRLNQRYSAALEADADLFAGESRYKITNWYFNDGVLAKEQLDYGFSLFFLPAVHVNNVVSIFGGPGISTGYFAVKTDYSAGNAGVSSNYKHWLTGGGLKVGTVSQLSANLALLLTYQFTQYKSSVRTEIEPFSGSGLQGVYRPYVNTVLIGLKFTMPEPAAQHQGYTRARLG